MSEKIDLRKVYKAIYSAKPMPSLVALTGHPLDEGPRIGVVFSYHGH